jgi:hypothetical protein
MRAMRQPYIKRSRASVFSLAGLSEADFAEDGYFYLMGVPPIRVDLLMGIPGGDFKSAWLNRF